MDYKVGENIGMDASDNNIKRLMKSAVSPVPAATFFKRGLLLHLKEELLRFNKRESLGQERSDAFEENLGRLMAASYENYTPVIAKPGFKNCLRDEIVTAGGAARRRRRLNLFSPALATAVVGFMLFMVLLFGFEIYPTHWADSGTEIAVTMHEGTGRATETRPVFFIWGNRTTKSNLASGETVSLSEGDKITVASGSTAVIDLFNQSTLKLYPDSVMEIEELESESEQGVAHAKVILETGRVVSEINNFSYELATPSTVITVSGTAFQTEVISENHTYLATSEGTVELTMNGDTVEVSAGEEVNAILGQELVVKEASSPKLVVISPDKPEVTSPDIVLTGETDIEAEVTVNGEPVAVNPDGIFSVQLSLDPGPNTVVMTATNSAGKAVTIEMALVLI